MNCEYCGKDMPESYHYEVGGTVDCGCRFKKKKEPNNIEAVKFSIALDKANQRIAELEATRVPDDLLESLIGEIGENPNVGLCEYEQELFDKAQDILRLRKEPLDNGRR